MPKARRPSSKPIPVSKNDMNPSTPTAELSPLDPAYETRSESELPALSFPDSDERDLEAAAEVRRRIRIRNELIFVVLLAILGLGVLAMARNPAFLALALMSAVAVVAYEVTVAALE